MTNPRDSQVLRQRKERSDCYSRWTHLRGILGLETNNMSRHTVNDVLTGMTLECRLNQSADRSRPELSDPGEKNWPTHMFHYAPIMCFSFVPFLPCSCQINDHRLCSPMSSAAFQ